MKLKKYTKAQVKLLCGTLDAAQLLIEEMKCSYLVSNKIQNAGPEHILLESFAMHCAINLAKKREDIINSSK